MRASCIWRKNDVKRGYGWHMGRVGHGLAFYGKAWICWLDLWIHEIFYETVGVGRTGMICHEDYAINSRR